MAINEVAKLICLKNPSILFEKLCLYQKKQSKCNNPQKLQTWKLFS